MAQQIDFFAVDQNSSPRFRPIYSTHDYGTQTFAVTGPQSAWGPGAASELSGSFEATQSWSTSGSIGGMVTEVPNPNPVWVGYEVCLLGGGPCVRPSSDVFGPRRVEVPPTGAELSLSTSGTVGTEVGYRLTAGSISPELRYNIVADVPMVDRNGFDALTYQTVHRIDTSRTTLEGGEINSVSPSAVASVTALLDVEIDATARGCAAGACISGSGAILDIDNAEIELIGFDSQRINLLQGLTDLLPVDANVSFPIAEVEAILQRGGPNPTTGNTFGVAINTIPTPNYPLAPIIDLASVKLEFPSGEIEGELQNGAIVGDVDDRLLTALIDLDGAIDQIPPGDATFPIGPEALNAAVTLKALDLDAGVTLDVYQEMRLVEELFVTLAFDEPTILMSEVLYFPPTGGPPLVNYTPNLPVTSWTGRWADLPWMGLFSSRTVTPTFFTQVSLEHEMGLVFGLEATAVAGQISGNVGYGSPLTGTIGPLVDRTFSAPLDFTRIPLFDETFEVGGFNSFVGDPMFVQVNMQGGPPTGPGPAPALVPLPASGLVLLGALAAIFGWSRRR